VRYLSVCSGIGSCVLALRDLGWACVGFAEIEPFASAVLAERLPGIPNYGDFTKLTKEDVGDFDLLIGGTPCQSFSLAGSREGLRAPNGNLALEYVRLLERTKPRWFIFENVVGLLSSGGRRDFGVLLGAMVESGFGVCWRVLDSRWLGVPQRRRRVYVVGYLGDWRPPAAVLVEPESLRGNPPKGRAKGPGLTSGAENRADPGSLAEGSWRASLEIARLDEPYAIAENQRAELRLSPYIANITTGGGKAGQGYPAVIQPADHAIVETISAPHADDGGGVDTARGDHLLPAFGENNTSGPIEVATAQNAHKNASGRMGFETETFIVDESLEQRYIVRRLTPLELERLQGLEDGWTQITYQNRPAKDGPRQRAIGNTFTVPVIRWIGQRIQMVEEIVKEVHGCS